MRVGGTRGDCPVHSTHVVTGLIEARFPRLGARSRDQAEVIAVGSGKLLENGTRVPPDVKAGDRILFGKYSGAETKIEAEEYLILREDEILGVIEK